MTVCACRRAIRETVARGSEPEDVIGLVGALEGVANEMGEQVGRLDANVGEVPGRGSGEEMGEGPDPE